MSFYHFALIDETQKYSASELYSLKEALEINGADCAKAWGLERPAIDVIDRVTNLPRDMVPLVFVDAEDPGTLAEHWYDALRGMPAARVFTANDSGLTKGRYSALE